MEKSFGQPSVSQEDLFSTPPILPTPEIIQPELDLEAVKIDLSPKSPAPEAALPVGPLRSYEMPAESYVIEAIKKLGQVRSRDNYIAIAKTPGHIVQAKFIERYGEDLTPEIKRWESERKLLSKDSFYAFAHALIQDNLILSDTDPASHTYVVGADSDVDVAYDEFTSWCFEDDGAVKRRSRLIRKMEKSIAAKQK